MRKRYKLISSIIVILMVFALLPLNNFYVFANSAYVDFDKDNYYQMLNSYKEHYKLVFNQYYLLKPEFSSDINSYNKKLSSYNTALRLYNNKLKDEQTIEEYDSLISSYNELVTEYSILKERISPLLDKYEEVKLLRSEYDSVLSLYNQQKQKHINNIIPDINFMSTLSSNDICFFIGDGKKNRWQLYVQAKGWSEGTGGGMGNMNSYFYEISTDNNIVTFLYPEKTISETISFIPKAGCYTLQVPSTLNDTYDDLLSIGNGLFLSNDISDLEAGVKWLDIWFDEDAYIEKPAKFSSPSNPEIQRPVAPAAPEIEEDKTFSICFSHSILSDFNDIDVFDTDFKLILQNNDTGNEIYCPIKNNGVLNVDNLSPGTYTIKESSDNKFNDFNITLLNFMTGVSFNKSGDDYVLTISDSIPPKTSINININSFFNSDNRTEVLYLKRYERTNLFIFE